MTDEPALGIDYDYESARVFRAGALSYTIHSLWAKRGAGMGEIMCVVEDQGSGGCDGWN